jgi:predicted flap endonuclease-1-like 5' DNA nuclease
VDRLFFLTEGTREALESKGVETSYAIDPRMLNEGERRSLALMHLKGLGLENLQKLQEQGVDTIEELAGLDQDQLSRMIGESNMRRVRVYLKAAREQR